LKEEKKVIRDQNIHIIMSNTENQTPKKYELEEGSNDLISVFELYELNIWSQK
jgi:hypothetical protein